MTDQRESKIVPLVYYHPSGEREIIGEATVTGDKIEGRMNGDISELARYVVRIPMSAFSIDEPKTPIISDSKEN